MARNQKLSNEHTHRLALKLRRAAEKRGYSAVEVAREMKVSSSMVNTWFRGEAGIRRHDLQDRARTAIQVWTAEATDAEEPVTQYRGHAIVETPVGIVARPVEKPVAGNGQITQPPPVSESGAYMTGYRDGYRQGYGSGYQDAKKG